jgi:hypothetical protein
VTGTSPAPLAQGETGPENIAATKQLSLDAESNAGADVSPLPIRWARVYIENVAGQEIPEYGTAAFQALEEGPVKVASCVVAAEAWRTRLHHTDGALVPSSRRAREITEARRPRPGDHRGGPVQWDEVAVDA